MRCTLMPERRCTGLVCTRCTSSPSPRRRLRCASCPLHSSCRSSAPRPPGTCRPRTRCRPPHWSSSQRRHTCPAHTRCTNDSRPTAGTGPPHTPCSPAPLPRCTCPQHTAPCTCRRPARSSLEGSRCTRSRPRRCACHQRIRSSWSPARRCMCRSRMRCMR